MLSEAITKKASKCKRTKLPYNGAGLSFTVLVMKDFV